MFKNYTGWLKFKLVDSDMWYTRNALNKAKIKIKQKRDHLIELATLSVIKESADQHFLSKYYN